MIRFAEEVRAQSPRFVSPIHFPETVGNYLAAALARGFGFRGPNLTLAGDSAGMEAVVITAMQYHRFETLHPTVVDYEALTVQATRKALAKLDADPDQLLK